MRPVNRSASLQLHETSISPARVRDLPGIERLSRRDSHALGFLSRAALREKIEQGLVLLARGDRRIIGFALHGSLRRPEVRLFQLAVDPAYRGRGIGRYLLAELTDRLTFAGVVGLSLRCRDCMVANGFWHSVGFELHGLEAARRGALLVWVRRLSQPLGKGPAAFRFHSRWHPCRRCGRMTCDTWVQGARRWATCAKCAGIGTAAGAIDY